MVCIVILDNGAKMASQAVHVGDSTNVGNIVKKINELARDNGSSMIALHEEITHDQHQAWHQRGEYFSQFRGCPCFIAFSLTRNNSLLPPSRLSLSLSLSLSFFLSF